MQSQQNKLAIFRPLVIKNGSHVHSSRDHDDDDDEQVIQAYELIITKVNFYGK